MPLFSLQATRHTWSSNTYIQENNQMFSLRVIRCTWSAYTHIQAKCSYIQKYRSNRRLLRINVFIRFFYSILVKGFTCWNQFLSVPQAFIHLTYLLSQILMVHSVKQMKGKMSSSNLNGMMPWEWTSDMTDLDLPTIKFILTNVYPLAI